MSPLQLRKLFFASPLDWAVALVPVALAIRYIAGANHPTLIFFAAGLGIVPLAGWMGRATEKIAEHSGPGIGALLNASFGNAAELIIGLIALSRGLTDVVKASITGSIIGNILLVFGASVILGGSRYKSQKFNGTAARVSATSLSLAAIGLMIPTVFHVAAETTPQGWSPQAEQRLSLIIALFLFATYVASLVFSLGTHRELFVSDKNPKSAGRVSAREPLPWLLCMLGVSTALTAWLAELLVGGLDQARESLGLSERFVGVVVLAIVGNAAEHATAITAGLKNKMDLSLGVTIGSSTQVALFVTPVLIFASYLFGRPMNLEFTIPEVAAVALSVWIVEQISADGESNWLEGVQLLCVYLVIAVLFFFLPEGGTNRTGAVVERLAPPVP